MQKTMAIDLSPVFKVDLVDINDCRPTVRQVIEREGVELFDDHANIKSN